VISSSVVALKVAEKAPPQLTKVYFTFNEYHQREIKI